ncbi:hypothetical protein AB0M50_37695 [Nonomuraea fuscirosea]|jgi:hypothetical protein|uniref:hypothetical protein n=1 Tax=Nonomuraea fuscirosea TaxID=1291556 RepID=UPI00343B4445
MGTISVLANLSLDGVMQGPGRADEDTRGGFRHGGWGIGYADEVIAKYVGGMDPAAAMLFGHRSTASSGCSAAAISSAPCTRRVWWTSTSC